MMELKSEDVQILLVEMQPPVVDASKTVLPTQLRRCTEALIEIAEAANIPITASVVPLGESAPKLINELGAHMAMIRSTITPMEDAAAAARLRSLQRNTLVLGGVSTEIAILHTAIAALDAGFKVHILVDLCGGLDPRTDQFALERLWRAGAVPSSLSSFATGLVDDMSSNLGIAVMRILDRYWGWGAHDEPEIELSEPSVDHEIEGLLGELSDAWSEGNAGRFARPFSSNARFVAFDGSVLNGPHEIADYHRGPFATHLAGTKLIFGAAGIECIDRLAWVVATEGGIERCGQTEGELIGKSAQTFLARRSGGRLQIVAFQNTRIRPIDGPAAAEAWQNFDESWSRLAR